MPSPFKRLRISDVQAVSFPAIPSGKIEVKDLCPTRPPHRKIIRAGDHREEAGRLLKQLLSECPQVRILSTCRTKLNLGGFESDFSVDPLDPKVALALFVHSIPDRDVRTQVESLPTQGMQHVVKLVVALDGHPLSILLAAHRIAAGTRHETGPA